MTVTVVDLSLLAAFSASVSPLSENPIYKIARRNFKNSHISSVSALNLLGRFSVILKILSSIES